MELIKWTDAYSVGIKEIDNQHKGLVTIINDLFGYMSKGKAKNNLGEIFDHLTDYTKLHFSTEEKILAKYAYPDFFNHKKEHVEFVNKLVTFKKNFDESRKEVSIEILSFLRDWLLNHIQLSDKKYSKHLRIYIEE
ncbi:MAG: bacteriohemerythrin [Bacteroidales bacterium]|nr:bacteriohemerythrin [Bacteroidales bacterium]